MAKSSSNMSTAELSQQLRGIHLPVSRRELIKRARDNNVDDALIRGLESMPEQEFRSVREIAAAMRQVSGQGEEPGEEGRRGQARGRHGRGER